ncbi:MAG: Vms1/Ankzf1 family peptidyl-tRNA hydrolase, partial [Betaproteobacteria bacterium]
MNATMTALEPSAARSLAKDMQPSVSVYMNLQPEDPLADAGEDLSLRWRRHAAQLSAHGADDATLAAVWRELARQPASPARFAVFANRGSVRFRQILPGASGVDVARFGAPAHVLPLLAYLQQHPPYVKVVTDRTGADLTAVPRGAAAGPTTVVVGPDDEIERNAPGGWAQGRYQHRAEDSWQHNAAVVAREVTRALHQVDARLLLIAGDLRAVQLLHDRLPAAVLPSLTVRRLPGGRQPDSSGPVRDAATADLVAEYADAETDDLLDRLDTGRGRGGLAVEGVAATLTALVQGRVDTLFVVDDPTDERI